MGRLLTALETLAHLRHAQAILDQVVQEMGEASAGERTSRYFRMQRKQQRPFDGGVDAAYVIELSGGHVVVDWLHDPYGLTIMTSIGSARIAFMDSFHLILDDVAQQVRRKHVSSGVMLTDRDMAMLKLLRLGMTNAQIGDRLGISESTVKNSMGSLFAKLGVDTRLSAVMLTLTWLLDPTVSEEEREDSGILIADLPEPEENDDA